MSYLEAAGFEEVAPVNGDKYDIVGKDSQILNIKVGEGEKVQVSKKITRRPTLPPKCTA